jgi:hypothetical protein
MSAERGPIRILIVDDHPLLREGIAALVGGQADMTLVAESSNGRDEAGERRDQTDDETDSAGDEQAVASHRRSRVRQGREPQGVVRRQQQPGRHAKQQEAQAGPASRKHCSKGTSVASRSNPSFEGGPGVAGSSPAGRVTSVREVTAPSSLQVPDS